MSNNITYKKIDSDFSVSKVLICEKCWARKAEVRLDKNNDIVAHRDVNFSYLREKYLCDKCFFEVSEINIKKITKKDIKELKRKIGI